MRLLRIIAVLLAVAVSVAACSSTSGSDRPAAVSSHTSDTTAATSSGSPRNPAPGRDMQHTCTTLSANINFLTSLAGGGADAQLQQQIAEMRALQTTAPIEIRNDVAIVADFDQRILDMVMAGRPDLRESPQLTAAIRHIVGWTARHCTDRAAARRSGRKGVHHDTARSEAVAATHPVRTLRARAARRRPTGARIRFVPDVLVHGAIDVADLDLEPPVSMGM